VPIGTDILRNKLRADTEADGNASETNAQLVPKYVVISPIRDEEQFIASTIDSMINQTILPAQWIIVNDGSTDRTGEIANESAARYSWIAPVHRRDRGQRIAGTGVIEAFYEGFTHLNSEDWAFIVKLDGDVSFEPTYFAKCFRHMAEDPSLGICGGVIYTRENGRLKMDVQPTFHVRGAIKLYRRACWEAIGGLLKSPGWDTVDEIHANMLGWRTRSFPELRVIHHKPSGAAAGAWRDSVKNGRADYVSGYHPLFVTAKCVRRLFQRPYVTKSLGHIYGYVSGYTRHIPRITDARLIQYHRTQQLRRLFCLKTDLD